MSVIDGVVRFGPARRPLADRLWEKVVRLPSGCHEWTGLLNHAGYGTITKGGRNGQTMGTHRAAWELINGPIPKGMFVCHTCDNPPCCNVDHLWLGTNADNTADRHAKGRDGTNGFELRTHCPHGHLYDEANTKVEHRRGTTARVCRACARARSTRYGRKQATS